MVAVRHYISARSYLILSYLILSYLLHSQADDQDRVRKLAPPIFQYLQRSGESNPPIYCQYLQEMLAIPHSYLR